MSNTVKKNGLSHHPSPELIQAFRRVERLSIYSQGINDWAMAWHEKDREFCELFRQMTEVENFAFDQALGFLIPFESDDEIFDLELRDKHISKLLKTIQP